MTSTSHTSDVQTDDHALFRPVGVAIGLVIAGRVAAFVGAALLGVVVALAFGPDSVTVSGPWFRFAGTLVGQLFVFAFALGYLRRRSLRVPVGLPSRNESLVIAASVVASVAAALGLTVLRRTLLPGTVTSTISEMLSADPSLALAFGVSSVLLIAPAEELLFRGAVQGHLGERFGTRPAIAGASTLFAGWHLLNFGGSILGTLLAASVIGVVSLLWGYAYERTGNFAVPVLTHGLYNMTLMLISYAG